MNILHRLRRTRTFVRLALAWFVLSLGVAVASPVVKPERMEMVCSGSGIVKLLIATDDGLQEVSAHTLDCPLCVMTAAPPPVVSVVWPQHQPLSHALTPLRQAHIHALTAAPLSARAPPAL